MKLAILIMTHRLPEQVALLCKMLQHENIDIYIHVDKKVDVSIFEKSIKIANINYISNRISTTWGGFSIVETIIQSYEEILQKNEYDYICNISGQDFPIKRTDDLLNYLIRNKGKEFIENIPCTSSHYWWKENKIRVDNYSFINLNIKGKYKLEKIANQLLPPRKPPNGLIFSGNSGWFCLSKNAISYILKSYREDKKLINFFKYVWGADEIYFSTVLYNSKFKDQMVGNLVFTLWESDDKLHPKVLTLNHKHLLDQSDKFFARKFDYKYDSSIIELYLKTLN
jgi:hypothetical protein